MQGSKTQIIQAEYNHVRYKVKFQGHNPTYDVKGFTASLPGACLTPSMPVTCNLRGKFVRFTSVFMLKAVTLLSVHLRNLPTLLPISVRRLVIYIGLLRLKVLLQIQIGPCLLF